MAKRYANRQESLALYVRDKELFGQKMLYTFEGITWHGTPCCYCGDPATAEDHVFPVSALWKLSSTGGSVLPRDILRIVPACLECNAIAGDKVFHTFAEKRAYIKSRLASKYGREIDAPHWDADEIAEMRGRLREWIAVSQEARDMIFERLRF